MAVEIEDELTLRDYILIAKRRWLQILAAFLVSLTIITMIAFLIPPFYKAEGFIAIESPVISKALINDDVNAASATRYVDEHIDKVKQKIFSRENLVKINQKYSLYPNLTRPSEIAASLDRNIKLEGKKKSADHNEWSGQVTVGFSVKVQSDSADTTYKLTNDIISQLLEQNTKDRTRRATETTNFLTSELDALEKELAIVEDKVAQYKQKHSDSLPEHQQLHMTTLEELRTTLKSLDLEYEATREELRYLDVELTTANATISNAANNNSVVTTASALDKARAELERSMVLYKETHPTIRALKRKVALLESKPTLKDEKKSSPKKVNLAAELAIAKINSQTEAANARLQTILEEKRFVRNQMEKIRGQIVNIPQVERGLASLLRDYENVKRKYEDVKAKQVNAKIAEDLEIENKAERFVLLESPEYPQYKANMSRTKMVGLGIPASLILALGLALLLESADNRIRKQSVLMAVADLKPLAAIPYINTQEELNHKKRLRGLVYFLITLLVTLSIALAITHFFIIPLDELEVLRKLRG